MFPADPELYQIIHCKFLLH